jgi:adenylyltransferase/sulfurtransferase
LLGRPHTKSVVREESGRDPVPAADGEANPVPRESRFVILSAMFGVPSITVEELQQKQSRGEAVTLLDVREPHEWTISDLAGSVKIPLGTLPMRFSELPAAEEIVVYCRTGGRSAQAVQFLRQRGFERASNLVGGINRWAEIIDPSLRRY